MYVICSELLVVLQVYTSMQAARYLSLLVGKFAFTCSRVMGRG
jgi:hypothetical protein